MPATQRQPATVPTKRMNPLAKFLIILSIAAPMAGLVIVSLGKAMDFSGGDPIVVAVVLAVLISLSIFGIVLVLLSDSR